MMRVFVLLLAVFAALLCSTQMCHAAEEYGTLAVDFDDPGEAFLCNFTNNPIAFEGYTIGSRSGNLNPAAFVGIGARIRGGHPTENAIWVMANLGSGALAFVATDLSPLSISETDLVGEAVIPPGFRVSLGACVPSSDWSDLTFSYSAPGRGIIDVVSWPEPGSLSLLAIGALLRFRRRRSLACGG